MAGGKGSRMGFVNKPLLKVCSRPMIEHVITKIRALVQHIVIAMSRYTLGVKYLCRDLENIDCVFTTGADYVEDLRFLISALRKPILTVPADIPLVPLSILIDFIERGLGSGKSVVTLTVKKGSVLEHIGVSIFNGNGDDWVDLVYDWRPELINVNTVDDLKEVEGLCEDVLETSWRFCAE